MAIRVVNKLTGRIADVLNQRVINISADPPTFQVLYRIGESLYTRNYEDFWLLYERVGKVEAQNVQTRGYAITIIRDMAVGEKIDIPILAKDLPDNIRNRFLSAAKLWNQHNPDNQITVRTKLNRRNSTIEVCRIK